MPRYHLDMKMLLLTTFAGLMLSGAAVARPPSDTAVDERFDKQEARIKYAKNHNQLSDDRFHRLHEEGQKIREREGRMRNRNTGDLSQSDRWTLAKDLDRRSWHIQRDIETSSR